MDIYKDCRHLQRTPPPKTTSEITPELVKLIEKSARTLPTFETTLYNIKLIKHYSFETNEFLRCRWQKFKDSVTIVQNKTPCQLANQRDLHFYNGQVRMISGYGKGDHRKMNLYGPGVDKKGQMPIPFERLMKRGVSKKPCKTERKVSKKNDKNDEKTGDKDKAVDNISQTEKKGK